LQQRCDELFEGQASSVYPYLAHLLSLNLEGDALERVRLLGPQTLQAQYLFALRELIGRLAVHRPTIFVLEDVHWADPSSTELLIKLLPLSREVPLLFIFLARPERETAGWRLVSSLRDLMGAGFVEITLRPLNETDSEKLVENLLDLDRLPAKVREIILSKAEGNPFFVEEVIRMLIDQGVLVNQDNKWIAQKEISSTEIPDNLQGLLLARIDRLPDDVKQTLRVASVIGRQFSVKVLEQVLARQKSNLG
jgi:adenylate cyclase